MTSTAKADERQPGRIAVTGLGAVGPWGTRLEDLEGLLRGGRPVLVAVPRPPGYHRAGAGRSRHASLVAPTAVTDLLPAAAARRMSWPSRLAVSAARLAVADAGLEHDDPQFTETGVAVATTYGPAAFTEQLLDAIFHRGPEHASPALFTESVASAAASQISIDLKALAPCLTVTQREAGVLQAVADAASLVERGRARRMLAGAVEEVTGLLHSILDRLGAVARPEGGGEERARPFDRRRSGFIVAEGAAVVVLEREADAIARGASIRCRLAGAGSAFDPTASRLDWGSGAEALAAAFRRDLARCGLAPADFDLIVSGASGTRSGDRLEASVLRALWRDLPLPPVVAPKEVVGEYGGGYLAAALLAVERGVVPGAVDDFEIDPALGIGLQRRLVAAPRRALVTTLAAGGAASWLAFER